MRSYNYILILVPLLGILLGSCKKEGPLNPYDDPSLQDPGVNKTDTEVDPESFIGLYQNIFQPTCANSGCHDGTFEPDFRTIESSFNTLVYHDIIKNDVAGTYAYRVLPGNADKSVLYQRLVTDIDGQSGIMPLSLEPDSDWEAKSATYINNIKNWINNGALDMFGNAPQLTNLEPEMQGVVGFSGGSQMLDRAPGKGPIQVPAGTSQLTIWISVQDAETATNALTYNKYKLSEEIFNFEEATEQSLDLQTPMNETGYFDEPVDYFHSFTIDPSAYPAETTVFIRVYIQDDENDVTEIPKDGSAEYILKYFAFEII